MRNPFVTKGYSSFYCVRDDPWHDNYSQEYPDLQPK